MRISLSPFHIWSSTRTHTHFWVTIADVHLEAHLIHTFQMQMYSLRHLETKQTK